MKPKRVPRLWCARQGLLPLELKTTPTSGWAPGGVVPVVPRGTCSEKIPAAERALPPAAIGRATER